MATGLCLSRPEILLSRVINRPSLVLFEFVTGLSVEIND